MIDKSKIKKMWVWDGDNPNPKDEKRYVIDICKNGCVAVTKETERDFEEGYSYHAIGWNHYEEIEEPTLDDLEQLQKVLLITNIRWEIDKEGSQIILEVIPQKFIFTKNGKFIKKVREDKNDKQKQWQEYEPIKNPTLNDLPKSWEDAWYRIFDLNEIMKPLRIDYTENELYFLGKDSQLFITGIEHLKNGWQIKINGEWHNCSEYLGGNE